MYLNLELYKFLVEKYEEKGREPFIKYEEIKEEFGFKDIKEVKTQLRLLTEGSFIREDPVYFVKVNLIPLLVFKRDGIEYYLTKKRDIPNVLRFLSRFSRDSNDYALHQIMKFMPD